MLQRSEYILFKLEQNEKSYLGFVGERLQVTSRLLIDNAVQIICTAQEKKPFTVIM
jgi:hypothetical protein